jgi:hypothetical protein
MVLSKLTICLHTTDFKVNSKFIQNGHRIKLFFKADQIIILTVCGSIEISLLEEIFIFEALANHGRFFVSVFKIEKN